MLKKKTTIAVLVLFIGFLVISCFLFFNSNCILQFKANRAYLEFPFRKGEVIDYDVKLYNFRIGRAQLSYQGMVVKDKVETILITLLTDVANFHGLDKIYANLNTFNPLWVLRDITFFGKQESIIEDYSLKPNSVTITKFKAEKETARIITSDEYLQHVIASIYHYRRLEDFDIGKEFSLNLPLKKLKLKVIRIEEVRVPAGNFKAFYIESKPNKFKVWLSADEKRIPLKIVGAVSLAPATMVMRGFKE